MWRLVLIVAIGLLVASAAPAAPAHEAASTRAAKPAVRCRAGQVRVRILKQTRCRALRKSPRTADPRLALLRAAIGQNLAGLRTSGGQRIPPLSAAAGGAMKGVQARVNRALPKILAWADGHFATTTAVSAAAAGCGPPGADDSTTIDGFTISLSSGGDLTISADVPGGFHVEVFVGSGTACSRLKLPACPTAAGALAGTDAHQNTVSLRVTKDGQLVQSVVTGVRSTQTLRGTVADDAKLDTLSIVDTSHDSTAVAVPGGELTMLLTVHRSAEVDMHTGTPKPGTVKVDVRLAFSGTSLSNASRAAAEAARKYEDSFSSLINEEVRNYRAREDKWQSPGACAKLTFSPRSDGRTPLRIGTTGLLTARIQANAGGVAAKARWKRKAQANGVFTPPTARGAGTTRFHYRVTREGRNVKVTGVFRATSTAGVAEGTWRQPTKVDPNAYYRIESVSYSANHSSTWPAIGLPCAGNASAAETGGAGPIPFDPAAPQTLESLSGLYSGQIGSGPDPIQAHRTGVNHGCNISVSPPPPPCDGPIDLMAPVVVGVIVQIPSKSSTAKVTWVLPSVSVGDNGPASPCYTPTWTAVPLPEERTEPASTFLAPGVHTVSVTRNLSVSGVPATITGITNASITFQRVNADGSPYTG